MVDQQPPHDALRGLVGGSAPAQEPRPYPSRRELRASGGRVARQGRALERTVRASSPKSSRRNPLTVLVTMGVVGGMFGVAGLPAYALGPAQTEPTEQTAQLEQLDAQSVVVSGEATALGAIRDGYHATTPEQLAEMSKDALRAANNAEYLASGARELGDDYPWAYELSASQGGGLSPLNYFYRECVDFVAWRLNRDQGYHAAPYKWVWSTLTPTGGNASQWLYAWQSHGWTVSSTPVVGAVAWFTNNHVAYVKSVPGDGTVLIEEYNHNYSYAYGQRVLPISSVPEFLYPPS